MTASTCKATLQLQQGKESSNGAQPKNHEFNLTYCCAHSHAPHLSSALYHCDHRVCVWRFVDECVKGRLFFSLSQKSQGFELFMKCNQACVKGFPLCFSSLFFGVCDRVFLFVCLGISAPARAGSSCGVSVYCLLFM